MLHTYINPELRDELGLTIIYREKPVATREEFNILKCAARATGVPNPARCCSWKSFRGICFQEASLCIPDHVNLLIVEYLLRLAKNSLSQNTDS